MKDGTNARGGTVLLDKKIKMVGILCFIFALLFAMPGCTSETSGDKAFTNLENAANKEDVFNQQQKPLIEEEKAEQDLYKKIMALDLSKYDQIKEYSDEALKHVNKRDELIEKEKKSIDDAYNAFKEAVPYLKKTDNKDALPHAKNMIDDMTKRYQAFQDLYTAYKESIKLDTSLFTMLKDKNLTKDDLSKQLGKVNDAYKKVDQQKDIFNELTQSFNKEKRKFYKILKLGDA
jgi:hypothetical protein